MGLFNDLDKALDIANEVRDEAKYIKGKMDYYTSEKFERDRQLVAKLQKQTTFIVRLTLLIWIILIIATIVFCVIGNDIVLKLLKL